MTSTARLERIDLAVGAGLAIAVAVEALVRAPSHPVVAAILSAAAVLPVAWRRRYPLGVLAWLLGMFVFENLVVSSVESLGLVLGAVAMAIYGGGAYTDGRRAGAGLAIAAVGMGSVQATFGGRVQLGEIVWLVVISLVFWLLARAVRTRTRLTEELHENALRAEEAREAEAERAVAEERRRIAREMHDIVAHSVSVMVVQAGGARSILGRDPERAPQAAARIEETGRAALAEMRRLLGVLHAPDGHAALVPAPSLEAIDALVARARDAGLPVRLRVEGTRRALPPGVDLAAYRVVQEAITNAIKHAAAAETDVLVRYGSGEVELEVSDRGAPEASAPALAGAGHGLVGMRERVRVFGGELSAGRRDGGGFAVRARIPLHADTEEAA
ncbi:MAG: sensor histidine kinase [Solirubrobacteraceae bacterium]